MTFEILGIFKDARTDTPVVYAQISIEKYFALIGPEFDKFSIQRRKEKHHAYARMKADIRDGVLLPTITLAPPLDKAPALKALAIQGQERKFADALAGAGNLNILDGLQRTYVLKDLADSGHEFLPEQTLHLEIRIEPDLKHLIYRIIVLNAGQKPMSMRHQIEILFLSFQSTLEHKVPHLELFTESEQSRRDRPRKFALDKIAGGYHAFLLKSPEVQKQNVVAQRITEESVLETDEDELGQQFSDFSGYLEDFCRVDDEVCRVYDGTLMGAPTGISWFGGENVINGFFAAVSDFGSNSERKLRIQSAINSLIKQLTNAIAGDDPMGLLKFQEIVQGFPTRKINVGFATRKLAFVSFREFFRDEGDTALAAIWEREAE